jgi:O-antigen ligase
LLLIGLTSGLAGLIQSIGGADGSFYFYDNTNRGAAVGLFANRNHQAVLLACLFPMLAAYCSIDLVSRSRRKFINMLALTIGGALIPLILVTGSRSGLILGLLALLSIPFIYRNPVGYDATHPTKLFSTARRYLLIATTVMVLATVTITMSRGEAFQRLSKTDQMEDLRFRIWNPIASAAEAYFPLGSGPGSIVQIYQLHEPDDLLTAYYVNQAHNDALDMFLTMGIAGIIVAAGWLIWIIWKSRSAWQNRSAEASRSSILARLGSVVAPLWIMASLGDYPLRTPLAASVFIVALVWINSVSHIQPKKLEVSSSFS